jgi:DNA-binding protein H-NS
MMRYKVHFLPRRNFVAKQTSIQEMKMQDLKDLQRKVNAEVEKREAEARTEKLAQLRVLADELDVAIVEKAGVGDTGLRRRRVGKQGKDRKARASGDIVYRDPNGNQWTGRGRRPKWIVEAQERGEDIEQFRIAS